LEKRWQEEKDKGFLQTGEKAQKQYQGYPKHFLTCWFTFLNTLLTLPEEPMNS